METQEFTSEQLEAALFAAFDLFAAALLDFFLMGNTAIQAYNGEWLKGNKILLGVRQRDISPAALEILKIADPSIAITDKKIIMEHEGVPIEIRIIRKHYRTLDNLDQIIYASEHFLIPNPFDAFLVSWRFMH